MKKMIALLLAALMVLSMAACASKTADTTPAADAAQTDAPADTTEPADAAEPAEETDLAYIQNKGTLVIGITTHRSSSSRLTRLPITRLLNPARISSSPLRPVPPVRPS